MNKVLLISLALVLVISTSVVGCGGVTNYNLTMAVNPVGGGTTTPTGTTSQAAGASVNIQAVANPGYQFVNWSAPAGTFGNANLPTTTFTMPARDVTVTANFVRVYNLTMAVSPPGAGTTTPSGTTSRAVGAVVNIQATALGSYQFVNWSATAGTFANANAAQTTFTMPAQDVTVTAHFVGPIDHFTCYSVDSETYIGEEGVYLEDQFGAVNATVEYALVFGNPAEKQHGEELTPISNPDHHFTVYTISYEEEPQTWVVEVKNQFGTQELTVWGPVALAVPTQKVEPGGHEPPLCLDHYLLYMVTEGPSVDVTISLDDEFGEEPEVYVADPYFFANPVQKTHGDEVTEIVNPEVHAVIYSIYGEYFEEEVQVVNQFGEQTLDVSGPYFLAVPSEKLYAAPVLDHFKCYWLTESPNIGEVVYLEDQFCAVEATVNKALEFCNPTGKVHDGVEAPYVDFDHHLTVYGIDYESEPLSTWQVEVENQFGTQTMTVEGPVALAVPTQKEGHEPPEGLDHYLLYLVVEGTPVDVTVDLWDQFGDWDLGVTVYGPILFANPVRKTHDGEVTEIMNPDAHLVFYAISGEPFSWEGLNILNQFGLQSFDVDDPYDLAVPSLKLSYEPIP